MSQVRFRYRVSVNNNFRGTFGYLDFKKFGLVSDFSAFSGRSSGPNEGETEKCIGVYLNRQLCTLCGTKQEALDAVQRLVAGAPTEAKRDFEKYADILYKIIRGGT